MLWHIELKFCIWLCFTVLHITFECCQFASIFVGVMPLLGLRILEIHSFPFFSLTSFDILSWNFVLHIKFECHQFASILVGVMPLFDLRILEIHSIPHFSDFMLWHIELKFYIWLCLMYYRSSSSVINSLQFLLESCPFWNLEHWKYTVFLTFLLSALTYWAEIFHMTLFNVL